MMRSESSFGFRVNGLSLPGLPITSKEDFATFVKGLLENENYKIMGLKPGDDQEPMRLRKAKQIDAILDVGGEINICDLVLPLVG